MLFNRYDILQLKYVKVCLYVLFDLVLYVHGKQLRSFWDGQLLNDTIPVQASWRQFTSVFSTQSLASIWQFQLFLNQWKREIICPQMNMPDARIDRQTAACQADMLPTELSRPNCLWNDFFWEEPYERQQKTVDRLLIWHKISQNMSGFVYELCGSVYVVWLWSCRYTFVQLVLPINSQAAYR